LIKACLFDMDGTFLPMNVPEFLKYYGAALAGKVAPGAAKLGLDPKQLVKDVFAASDIMIDNTSAHTNEVVFWRTFSEITGQPEEALQELIGDFYRTDFQKAKPGTGVNPAVTALVRRAAEKVRVIVTTNPVFPKEAQVARVRWAGLEPELFEEITSYENYTRCKPHASYFAEVLEKHDLKPDEVLVIGNDAKEDLCAAQLGIKVFLLTNDLLHADGVDLTDVPKGGEDELEKFLEKELA